MTIFHLLLLVLVFSTECMADPDSCSIQTGQYDLLPSASSQTVQNDELLLALQWPTSYCYCYSKPKITCDHHPIPLNFTVHGLWLNKNWEWVDWNGDNIKLDLQISSDLRADMEEHWPDLRSKEHPEDFWIREYRKHGQYRRNLHKQEVYFGTALQIKRAIGDLMTMPLRTGKTLIRGEFYHVSDFQHVTIARQTLIPRLRCNRDPGNKHPQLHEIVFCSDIQKNLKNCTFDFDGCLKPWNERGKSRLGYFKFP